MHLNSFLFENLGSKYDASSVKRLSEFLIRCRQNIRNNSNLFWVSVQSNLLIDLNDVEKGFKKSFKEMCIELKSNGWILPILRANMRNQVNIAKIGVEGGYIGKLQLSIEQLPSGSSLIGEVPQLLRVDYYSWPFKRLAVLKHCIEWMAQKSEMNIVVLWDSDEYFKDVSEDVKRVVKNKKVVVYPPKKSKKEGISNIKDFVEKNDNMLVTESRYFNGCESPNVIYLTFDIVGVRNNVLRGVQNILCIQLTIGGYETIITGMKQDNRYCDWGKITDF